MSDPKRAASDELLARVRASLHEHTRVARETLEAAGPAIVEGAELMVETFRAGGKVLAFGNGGSAADAQHLCAELTGRFRAERPALPALALTVNPSDLTAIGNDYGFEHTFARLVQAHGRGSDLAVAISTSGTSANVVAAAAEARERGLKVLALTGRGGGELAALADVSVAIPSDTTARIQEAHITVLHVICELVDRVLFPETLEA